MKITLTGSLGHIGKPLTEELVQKGHSVTVISSNPERQAAIEDLGAKAAIGTIENKSFLTDAFTGAGAVYCMVPPANYFDPNLDLLGYYKRIGNNYAQVIKTCGVKRVINLSSIGAHLNEGNGILQGNHHIENILNDLPSDIAITHIRPTEFYYNLYSYTEMIKSQGIIATNCGKDVVNAWVSPRDIADTIAKEITKPFSGRKVCYVASDEVTCEEVAKTLGAAIGKPYLKWIMISDEEARQGLEAIGMQQEIAADMVEMRSAIHTGLLYEDYNKHKPAVMGKVKVTDFAKKFADIYSQ